MSKSEFPAVYIRIGNRARVLTELADESVDAMSIEWEKEYDANAWRPRDKRRLEL